MHGTNSAGEAIYVPATINYHVTNSLVLLGDFKGPSTTPPSTSSIKNYAPVGTVSVYHGPCAMSENALEKTITLCIGGTDYSGNVLFNPS